MPEFIVNRAACDYLTVTTFDWETYLDALDAALESGETRDAEKSNIPRYAGQRVTRAGGSVFYGEGVQSEARHWIITASGAAADAVAGKLAMIELPHLKVTRLDVQLTLEKPAWYRARNFIDAMTNGEWNGRSAKCTLLENSGNDTVYIGSYASDRFVRVYVKEREWLRFEVVFKRDYAPIAWDRFIKVPHLSAAGLIVGQLVKLPPHPTKDLFGNYLKDANQLDVKSIKPVQTLSKTYIWMVKQVGPALRRLLNDHDAGDMARQFLEELLSDVSN